MGLTIRQALQKAVREKDRWLTPKVHAALEDDCFRIIRFTEQQVIDEVVYDAYTPKLYQRRGEYGGMADPTNIEMKNNGASDWKIEVINTTEPNDWAADDDSLERVTMGKNLPELIEYGDGYRGYRYDFSGKGAYMRPRPFTAKTIEALITSEACWTAMFAGLEKRGLRVEKSVGARW